MTRVFRAAAVVLLVAAVVLPAAANKANSLYKEGRDAEARQDYEAAFGFYKQAYELKPQDLRYRTSYERLKFLAAASHVHKGQLLRDDGKLQEALAEFKLASQIDPSSFIATQELRRTMDIINKAANPPTPVAPPPGAIEKRLQEAAGPVELASISNVPITLKLTEDSKVIYETIGKLAGVNVLFDPDYTSRRIRIELNGVTLEEALRIVALESKTFWRPVTPNTIFIAQDNAAKRKEVEQSVLKTFYLSNLSQATELQDVVNAMRTLLEVQKIQQLPSQNAIIVRGTPDQIALAQKLVNDIDKARPEVIVEVAVLQISKDRAYNLGINPPTSATISLNSNISNTTSSSTSGTTSTTSSTTSSSNTGINLNRLGNLNATDFTITIPPASVNAMMSDSRTKILQNPQIRALDGQKASLKIGDRVPVATGSFQPGIGGVGVNPLVNTQFQYLDVGVNIDMTPYVHAGREVTLKVGLDISSVTGSSNIGGISQPIIGQRKIEHEIRLKEGEVNLLGGMFENDSTKSLNGLPGLGSIPVLKYLFAAESTDNKESEIVFALIPHIVRGPDVTPQNQEMLDVGTATSLQLRRVIAAATPPVVQAPGPPTAAAAPPQGIPERPGQPAPAPAPGPAVPTSFLFDPATVTAAKDSTFSININIGGAQNVYSVPLQLNYDPAKIQLVNISNGGFLSQDGQSVALVHREDEATGTVQITATRPPNSGGVSGQGSVVTLTFLAKAPGQAALTITRGGARDPSMQPITVNGAQAVVTIQ